jgi:FAD/FMN-containing dehydrogenase
VSPDVPTVVARLVAELATVVGPDQVLTDPALTRSYEVDITGLFGGRSTAVVRPGSAAEVAAVLGACRLAGVPVVVQGGGTALLGGSVPAGGEVVLSTRRLSAVGAPDTSSDAASVLVGAGATLSSVQAAVRPHGWDVGVDLASRDSATIGGMVGTNAGGEHVLRYGRMRDQVFALRATAPDGSELGGLVGAGSPVKGRDVEDLLVGSEGTLAVVTDVRLRLVRRPGRRAVALLALQGVQATLAALGVLRDRAPAPLTAAELMLASGMQTVLAATGLPAPVAEAPAYLLVEVAADEDTATDPASLVDGLADAVGHVDGVLDATLAADAAGTARLWRYRESHPEAIAKFGRPVKLDVCVPEDELDGFLRDVGAVVGGAAAELGVTGTRVVAFGHLGVQNMHVNVLGLDHDPAAVHAATDAVLRDVAARGGSVSAEHGVGRAKVEWLSLAHSADEIAAMADLKRSLDPTWMLGPGVLLPRPAPADPHTGRS